MRGMATQPNPHDHCQMPNWANANHNRPIPDQITGDTTLCADKKPSDDKACSHGGRQQILRNILHPRNTEQCRPQLLISPTDTSHKSIVHTLMQTFNACPGESHIHRTANTAAGARLTSPFSEEVSVTTSHGQSSSSASESVSA